ncbi:hypothetical protein NPIL_347071 [Nephila pilipes]|uniref:Uncharacterized protein n=1 Tax=Nephila pilipes TaxID=299642 RepID=A0A8X6USA5_NEPPI|nr:hypothetical protein NPIL_347071 [Nephila pilipes]
MCSVPVSSERKFLSKRNDVYSRRYQPIGSRRDYVIRLCVMSANSRKAQLHAELSGRRDQVSGETEYGFCASTEEPSMASEKQK